MAVYGAFNQGSSPLRLAVRKRPAPRCKGKGQSLCTRFSRVCASVYIVFATCLSLSARRRGTRGGGVRADTKGWRTRGLNISGVLSGLCWLGIASTRERPLHTRTNGIYNTSCRPENDASLFLVLLPRVFYRDISHTVLPFFHVYGIVVTVMEREATFPLFNGLFFSLFIWKYSWRYEILLSQS